MTGFLFGDEADQFFSNDSEDKKSGNRKTKTSENPKSPSPGMSDESPLSVTQLTA
jgi:hypothetical protein